MAAQADSKLTSAKKAKAKSKKAKHNKVKPDGFLLFVPLVTHGNIELPVLNTFTNCVCFTTRYRLNKWRDHYQMDVVRVKRYDSVSKIPAMIKTLMSGRRPKGLALDPNPVTANQYDMSFVSKANDFSLTDDIEKIATFVKVTAVETKGMDLEVKDVNSGE